MSISLNAAAFSGFIGGAFSIWLLVKIKAWAHNTDITKSADQLFDEYGLGHGISVYCFFLCLVFAGLYFDAERFDSNQIIPIATFFGAAFGLPLFIIPLVAFIRGLDVKEALVYTLEISESDSIAKRVMKLSIVLGCSGMCWGTTSWATM